MVDARRSRHPSPRRRARPSLLAVAVLVALAVGACGGGSGASGPSAAGDRPDGLSSVRLTDVATGREVQLSDALDAPQGAPVLAFFWAPF